MFYLAEKYGGAGPLGCDTPEKRAVLLRWVRSTPLFPPRLLTLLSDVQLFFANSTLWSDLNAKNARSCDVLVQLLSAQGTSEGSLKASAVMASTKGHTHANAHPPRLHLWR